MNNCIFCKIANGELPCHKIEEDGEFMAFMDIFPPTFNGKIIMPVVIITTKKHLGSNVFEDLDEDEYRRLLAFTRRIAKAIQRGLHPYRVCMVFEGLEINHIHPKLYPIFADTYPGYLSTEKGQGNKDIRAPDNVLSEFAKKIKGALHGKQNS